MDNHRIENALAYIAPDVDRDTWARLAMALKSELAEDGYEVFDTWSQGGASYNATDTRDTWKSIKAGGGVGIGTLFHIAGEHGWKPDGDYQPPTPGEQEQRRKERAAADAQAEDEKRQQQAEAAAKAGQQWRAAKPASVDYWYLTKKGIAPHVARELGGALLLPMYSAGALVNLQKITELEGKRFLPGGRTKGAYCPFGKPDKALIVCEGYATGASLHEVTGHAVAVAFSAGNLKTVAEAMRAKFPGLDILVAGDNDASGTGQKTAQAAAEAVGGRWVVPCFDGVQPSEAIPEPTDYNDLTQLAGADAVRVQVESILAVPLEQAAPPPGPRVELLCGGDLTPEPIRWLWDGWLARGKLHVLAGAPGQGKSTIAMALAASVTVGGRWPDGTRAAQGNVLV